MPSSRRKDAVQMEQISRAIAVIRGQRVLLDAELAALYGVSTKRFNEQIRRNLRRFPADFMFRLSAKEASFLRSQNATLDAGRGRYSKYAPLAFTEHGAIMAATILNSPRAVEMSIYVVRAFARLREMLASNVELAQRFAELERRLGGRIAEHDEIIGSILAAIRGLMAPPVPSKRGIGFTADIGSGGTAGRRLDSRKGLR